MLKLSVALGILAALADVAGGLVLVRARGIERYLRYFVALGAGFLMAVALLEMTPESLKLNPKIGPVFIMVGYCIVHLLEQGPPLFQPLLDVITVRKTCGVMQFDPAAFEVLGQEQVQLGQFIVGKSEFS